MAGDQQPRPDIRFYEMPLDEEGVPIGVTPHRVGVGALDPIAREGLLGDQKDNGDEVIGTSDDER
jgi:hypothetical protein